MLVNAHRYVLHFYKEDGTPLGQNPAAVDWEPAREWTRFLAIRQGRLPAALAGRTESILPVWHQKLGEPYVKGFQISLALNSSGRVTCEFPTTYFKEVAREISTRYVKEGELKEGERFLFLTAAVAASADSGDGAAPAFTTEEVDAPLRINEASLRTFVSESSPHGEIHGQDLPVFLPQSVLDEAEDLGRRAGAVETGGILIGHLRRDAGVPEVFLEVTAQIPARHVVAELSRLTFTPETWTDARAAIDLRGEGEAMCGWWHSHPVKDWCRDCPPEKRADCQVGCDFFSEHDRKLHRVVFPGAYSVALVVNEVHPERATLSMFGWRNGLLELRGFHVLAPQESPGAARAPR
jgi:hypothetical protein